VGAPPDQERKVLVDGLIFFYYICDVERDY